MDRSSGLSPNIEESSSASTSNHHDQDNSSISANGKDMPLSQIGTPHTATTSSESAIGRSGVVGYTSPEPKKISPKKDNVSFCLVESLANNRNGVMGHKSPQLFKKGMPYSRKSSPTREHSINNSDHNECMPFNICPKRCGTIVLQPALFEKNREKRKELKCSMNDSRDSILKPGMVLLKNFISHADQIEIVSVCHKLGLGDGGFYQPGYNDEAKLRLHMMCLGKDWDPQRRSYEEFRSIDGAKPPNIPAEFSKLVTDAIQASHAILRDERVRHPDEAIPWMEPDICIVNFYTKTGKLGLHQDRDESPESIKVGLPVVSFSIGDTAKFLYGDDRDPDKAKEVKLNSGDVLIFGGKSRLIFHGVPSIISGSAPRFLADETNLRSGRLNLTFRKY